MSRRNPQLISINYDRFLRSIIILVPKSSVSLKPVIGMI